jgi:hypothetical protein
MARGAGKGNADAEGNFSMSINASGTASKSFLTGSFLPNGYL